MLSPRRLNGLGPPLAVRRSEPLQVDCPQLDATVSEMEIGEPSGGLVLSAGGGAARRLTEPTAFFIRRGRMFAFNTPQRVLS